jgi:hypothetical protein
MAVDGALRTEEAGGLVDTIVGGSEDSIVVFRSGSSGESINR